MTIWRAHRVHQHANQVLAALTQGFTTLIGRGSIIQWAIVGIVGIVLGIYTLGVSFLPPKWVPLFALAVLCPFIAMIFGNVRRFLLVVIILDIPFQLDTYLFWNEEVAALGTLSGLNISVTTLSLMALYALWFSELLTKVDTPPHYLLRMSLPLASYLVFVVLSVGNARDVILSLFEISLLLQVFLLFVYVVGTVRTRSDVLFIVTILLLGLVLESLVMIGLRIIGHSIQIIGFRLRIDLGSRVGGTVGSPIEAAGYLCLLLAPALSILVTQLGQYYKWLATLAFGFGVVALLFTLSRGAWIAFFLSVAVLCLLTWHRGWLSLTVPIATIVVVMLLFLTFQNTILTRILGDDNGSASSRGPLMKLAFQMIIDHPWMGVGVNNFAYMIKEYATPEFGMAWLYVVHNRYLLVWAETGIGALICFIWFLLAILHRGWQCWKFHDRFLSPLALAFIAAIAGQMVHMLVDVFRNRPSLQLLWLIAGLITAMRHMGEEG